MRNDYVASLRQYEVFRNLLQFLIHRAIELGRVELMRIVAGVDDVLFGETIAQGALVFMRACVLGLAGVVSKRAGS
jgi:hypothetical protein